MCMTYSKKKYLQFLKSCGIVSAGCAFYACNQGNDSFDNKQNDEKISPDEILTIVNKKLNSEFTNINKEEVLKFFNDNIALFQNNDSSITDFFSHINGNSELLNEFITGKNNIAINTLNII